MPTITIDLFVLVPFMLVSFACIGVMALFFFDFKRWSREAFLFRKARKERKGIVCIHYANGIAEYVLPGFDNDASDGYFYVKKGKYKFKPMSGDKTELLGGDLPVLHVYDNMLEPVSMVMVAHMSALAEELKTRGYDIRGIEKIFMYVLMKVFHKQEMVTAAAKGRTWRDLKLNEQIDEVMARLETILSYIDVNDETTRGKLREIIPHIMRNREELEMAIRAVNVRPFSMNWLMQAVESLIPFTSADYYNNKNQVEAFARSERSGKEYMPFLYIGLAAFLILIGVYLVTK